MPPSHIIFDLNLHKVSLTPILDWGPDLIYISDAGWEKPPTGLPKPV